MAATDGQSVHEEMERARLTFHSLVSEASPADLRRADGTPVEQPSAGRSLAV